MVGEMSVRGNVLVGKCPFGEVSFGEVSGRGIIRSGEMSVGKVSVREVSVEVLSSGKCPVRKLSYNRRYYIKTNLLRLCPR